METREEEKSSQSQQQIWIQEQDCLKRRLKLFDEFSWKLHSSDIAQDNLPAESRVGVVGNTYLRYVGGVDLSFVKEDSSVACGCIVVIDLETMTVAYEDYNIVHLMLPYIAGFLAFRESPVLLELLNKLAIQNPALYPQVLMVDGNGILHPRGFGLASHLGVLLDIPSIGVAKNLHFVDGLTHDQVRTTMQNNKDCKDELLLIGNSGQIWGAALRSTGDCCKPIFVSIGHRISLETALHIVKMLCKYRIPEPVRQADIRSRRYLQDHYKR